MGYPAIGCAGVLQQTEGVARGFDTHVPAMNAAIDVSSTHASSRIIAQALADFVDSHRADIAFLFTRIEAAKMGAGKAAQAYVLGDEEMAENAWSSAASTGDPHGFMPGAEQ
jgi:hypothetical protein